MIFLKSAYIVKTEPCGIKSFDNNLSVGFSKIGIVCKSFDIRDYLSLNKSNIILFHYVPSMYAMHTDSLQSFLQYFGGQIITILHGVYPKGQFQLKEDTYNPYIREQINLIIKHSKAIISLSQSTFNFLESWSNPLPYWARHILFHPGFNSYKDSTPLNHENYFFYGGMFRAKKNLEEDAFNKLLYKCKNNSIKIWVHDTKAIYNDRKNEITNKIWKYSSGQLSVSNWKGLISNSEIILFPYSTSIQTVSGLMAESISLGKISITTNFPYAIEMASKYRGLIIIDDDVVNWDKHLIGQKPIHEKINYPDWNYFIKRIIEIINKHGC